MTNMTTQTAGAPPVVAVVHVSCAPLDGDPVTHRVLLRDDGSVDVSEHEAEGWADTHPVLEALGGEVDATGCHAWSRAGDGGRWVAPVDVSSWRFERVGEWSEAARATAWRALGVVLTEQVEGLPDLEPDRAWAYLVRLPAVAGRMAVPLPLVRDLSGHVEPGGMDTWLDAGVPWSDIAEYASRGIGPTLAAQVIAAAAARAEHEDDPGRVSAPSVTEALVEAGVPVGRIPGLLSRAPYSGFPYARPEVVAAVRAEVAGRVPDAWVCEAVMSLPERDHLMMLAHAGAGEYLSTEGWGRAWAVRAAGARIVRLLREQGDPVGWPAGWEWPTAEEMLRDWREGPDE